MMYAERMSEGSRFYQRAADENPGNYNYLTSCVQSLAKRFGTNYANAAEKKRAEPRDRIIDHYSSDDEAMPTLITHPDWGP